MTRKEMPDSGIESPKQELDLAKKAAAIIMDNINRDGRDKEMATGTISQYGPQLTDRLNKLIELLLRLKDKQAKVKEVWDLSQKIEDFIQGGRVEQPGVNVADEFEKLIRRVSELSI